MEYGNEFHQVVAIFYRLINMNVLFSYDAWMDRYTYLLGLIPECTATIEPLMRNYCKMESKRSMSCPQEWFAPIIMEQYREIREPEMYAGTIDRVDHYDEDYLCVGDYKTGKMYNISSTRQEMLLYAVILNADDKLLDSTGKYVAYWCTIHPRYETYYVEPFKKPTFRALARNTAKIWDAVEEDDFPPKIAMHCDWCQFLWHCSTQWWYIEHAS